MGEDEGILRGNDFLAFLRDRMRPTTRIRGGKRKVTNHKESEAKSPNWRSNEGAR